MNKQITHVLEGNLLAQGLRFAIIAARFNEFYVTKLVDGAIDILIRHGTDIDDITLVWVPGSNEIPLAANKLAMSGKFNALIGLGVVIQGATQHAHYILSQVTNNLAEISLRTGVPTIGGIIPAESPEQALERSGAKHGNRGSAAALAAIEMANLLNKIS